MRKRKILGLIIPFLLVCAVALGTYTPAYAGAWSFSDVSQDDWYYEYVDVCVKNGVIDASAGEFRPDDTVTRGEFMQMVAAVGGLYTQNTDTAEHWAMPYWHMLDEAGLLEDLDIPATAEELDRGVTRYEMAVILRNLLFNVYGEATVELVSPGETIGDYSLIGLAYRGAVEQVYGKGILSGIDAAGTFCGNRCLRRSEAAKAIVCAAWKEYRADRSDIVVEPEPTPTPEPTASPEPTATPAPTKTPATAAPVSTPAPVVQTPAPVVQTPAPTQAPVATAAPAATPVPTMTPVTVTGSNPGDSFAFRYRNMSTAERRLALFGDENKTYFTSASDASGYVVGINVTVWDITSSGSWYTKSLYIEVNRVVVDEVTAIFNELYNLPEGERFPISYVGGARYSDTMRHAWGCALDINANYNYYMNYNTGQQVGDYCYLNSDSLYCIKPDSAVVSIFAKYGWGWGGSGWTSSVDYMHFSILASGG